MIALPNIWSAKLFYRYLSPKTLAYICIDERSIEKYGNHLDWDIKSKEKLTEKIILKFWDNININDFLDNYEQKYLIVLKKLGVRLAKYNLLIKHTNRYQSAMVTEQFAYEFPNYVNFELLIQTKQLSEQFLLDFWYSLDISDVYKYQKISCEFFRKIFIEETEKFHTHNNLIYASEIPDLIDKILVDKEILKLIDTLNLWIRLPLTISEQRIVELIKNRNFRNHRSLIEHISRNFPLTLDFIKKNKHYINFYALNENKNLRNDNIFVIKHNGSFYIMQLNSQEFVNFMSTETIL